MVVQEPTSTAECISRLRFPLRWQKVYVSVLFLGLLLWVSLSLCATCTGTVTYADLDAALANLAAVQFRLGIFDPADQVQYNKYFLPLFEVAFLILSHVLFSAEFSLPRSIRPCTRPWHCRRRAKASFCSRMPETRCR